jgi:hypothetical protein
MLAWTKLHVARLASYQARVDIFDEARAFQIARALIAEHGDDVGRVLQDKIDALTASRDLEQMSDWFIIRNAVTLTLRSGPSVH